MRRDWAASPDASGGGISGSFCLGSRAPPARACNRRTSMSSERPVLLEIDSNDLGLGAPVCGRQLSNAPR